MLSENDRREPLLGYESMLEKYFYQQQSYKTIAKQLDVATRKKFLKKFIVNILKRKNDLEWALKQDIQMHPVMSEYLEVYGILNDLKHLDTLLENYLQYDRIHHIVKNGNVTIKEPKGNCLIITPWYHPIQIPFLFTGIASTTGNTVMLKLSKHTLYSNKVIKQIINDTFPAEWVVAFEGDNRVVDKLLTLDYDFVYFSGLKSTAGRFQHKMANKPQSLLLEVKGSNVVLVDTHTRYDEIAEKIIASKFINAGQTYHAPDFIMVHEKEANAINQALLKILNKNLEKGEMYQKDYMKVSNFNRFDTLSELYQDAIQKGASDIYSGNLDRRNLYMEPMILADTNFDMQVLKQEVLGPILPIVTYKDNADAFEILKKIVYLTNLSIFSARSSFIEEAIFGTSAKNIILNEAANYILPFTDQNNGYQMEKFSEARLTHALAHFTQNKTII